MDKVYQNWQWKHNASMTDRGRIILSWHPRRYQFNLILKTNQLIHGEAIQLSTNKKFYITFVYGRNLEEQRIPSWDDLISSSQSLEDSWCVLGDFNSMLNQGERIGGIEVTNGEISDFAACIKHCGLIDKAPHNELWYKGFAYTYTKDKGFKDMVKHSLAQNQRGSSLNTL
ncbi:hypothetical protein Cgig2_009219 [Carnegiea gigantea]|uniref:Endonuclease/exonuclease/phosphatase domain-containing protein n=1 Tax=Carnegiea gigantea TaxID=171969 RepID=A0A9Q1GGD1_9CARY|nr:hypothetical protein Cgig2_009219 [Carnegiea gigantea]